MFKGVSWVGGTFKWQAKITVNGHVIQLGRFTSEADAALAYDAAARELFREFAAFNFPLPGERSALTGEIEGDDDALADVAPDRRAA